MGRNKTHSTDRIKIGDLVSLNMSYPNRGSFILWNTPDSNNILLQEMGRLFTEDVGIIIETVEVSRIDSFRSGGLYVKILSSKGFIGWIAAGNLRKV